eukprot:692167-Heterocapsa_arctica.AAC.1
MEFEKTEAYHVSEKQKLTKFGEEQTDQDKSENQDFVGPKEDEKKQRDCTARQKPTNKIKQGRRYKGEKEEGTRITSTNLSGSQFDYESMLEHCKDHIRLIQEHWRLKEELHTWETLAHMKGWQ